MPKKEILRKRREKMAIYHAGIMTNILSIIFIILIFSGWLDWYFKKDNIVTKNVILRISVIAFFSIFITIPVPYLNWDINVGGYLFPLLLYFWLWLKIKPEEKLQLFASTILLAAIFFLIKELIRLDPILLFWKQNIEIPLVISVIILSVASSFFHRFLLAIGSLVFGEFIFHFHHRYYDYALILGDGAFRDLLWISTINIIVLHIALQWFISRIRIKKTLKIWKTRGKEH